MRLNASRLMSWPFREVVHAYTDRDSMLYALSLGFGEPPTLLEVLEDHAAELEHVRIHRMEPSRERDTFAGSSATIRATSTTT